MNLVQLVLYGLGTTVGAGIYALVGVLAGKSGYYAPLAFLIASLMAGLTAMSFAELCARYPRTAAAALYVKEGFSSQPLSTFVGLMVIAAGLVSSAALVNAFTGYLHEFAVLDESLVIVLLTLVIGAIAVWGISESITIAGVITLIEVGGLLLIVGTGYDSLLRLPLHLPDLVPPMQAGAWGLAFSGALLAFYAFIGFEDMVEVAEEVRDVRRKLPAGILLTLVITTVLYMLVMLTAVLAVPPQELAVQDAPLAYLYARNTGGDATLISIIGMLSIINGALIQVIMASRVMYGMSARKLLPNFLAYVHARTRTPVAATACAVLIVITLALAGNLEGLAEATSLIMLSVFALVNLALLRIKRRDPVPEGLLVFPWFVPLGGFLVSAGFVLAEAFRLLQA